MPRMQTPDDIAGAIRRYLQDERGFSAAQAEGHFFSTGLLDSLELVRLVTTVEELFGLTVSLVDASLENFDSAESIAALVRRSRE